MNEFSKTRSVSAAIGPGTDWMTEVRDFDFILLVATDSVKLIRADEDFSADLLTELRAFSAEKELHLIWRGGALCGRIRIDGAEEGEEIEYLEENQVLWGKVTGYDGECALLHDDRGIDLNIPVPAGQKAAVGDRCFLTVRNYLNPGDFSFTDYRICGITFKKAVDYHD